MATAIYNGFNHRENCVHYLKNTVETEQQNLIYQAQHDELLDIYNRHYAMEFLEKVESEGAWDSASYVMADIEGFKGINATYGHELADEILKKVAVGLKVLALEKRLDKSFVDNYLIEGKDAFIDDVIRLSHDLNKTMTVEGVEEKWQYSRLKEFGADTIQGYYFSKPLPPDEAIRFVPGID